jgi:hypothetical protein
MNGSTMKEKPTAENGPALSANEQQNLGNLSNVIYQKSTNDAEIFQRGILKNSWIKESELSILINRVRFAKGNIRRSACNDIWVNI